MTAVPGKDSDKPEYLLNLIIEYTLCAPGGVKATGFCNVNSVESGQSGHIRKARPTHSQSVYYKHTFKFWWKYNFTADGAIWNTRLANCFSST